ncbi:MAG: putative racemase [Candidatus Methanofastidiosum methylothiophilum]|uniref:Putative racemase n=1 Tax=Candidatus Methanofastidiosum methylothiophilum TaxID=1705564 RepID=A0A150J807_9EURY|nr:MAG: putative racemase [Candidatus Methanofastidiosum methylthiophilus]
MKVLGLIGGMNWQSTVEYYKILNAMVNEKLGKNHSARILLFSVDFEEILKLEIENNWPQIKKIMIEITNSLENAGAEAIILCSNTMHLIAEDLEKASKVPLISVIDATAETIKKNNINSIGLLGTKFTMEEDFYKKRLTEKHKLKVLTPNKNDVELVNNIIYGELAKGIVSPNSKKELMRIVRDLVSNGAEGIILGCTELPMLISQEEVTTPLFDTLKIHMMAAVKFSLGLE